MTVLNKEKYKTALNIVNIAKKKQGLMSAWQRILL
jgi:hypothetical protein